MKVINLNDDSVNPSLLNETNIANWTISRDEDIMNSAGDVVGGNAIVLATNYVYNLHWSTGIDWDHALLVPSPYANETDNTIILRFNYTEVRELFEIKRMIAGRVMRTTESQQYAYLQHFDLNHFIVNSTGKTQ